jgi:hypothetical protein
MCRNSAQILAKFKAYLGNCNIDGTIYFLKCVQNRVLSENCSKIA